jgi:hypothetical protein
MLQRGKVERAALILLNGWRGQLPIGLAPERELYERILGKLDPNFRVEGRPDDALAAAVEFALSRDRTLSVLIDAEERRQNASKQSAEPMLDGATFDTWRKTSQDSTTPYSSLPELAALEQERQNTWRANQQQVLDSADHVRRADFSDFHAQLAALEQKRQNAWRKGRP